MSNIKFVPDLFLETIELNRFKQTIFGDGFVPDFLNNAGSYGIIRNLKNDQNFLNFSVIPGTASGTIKIFNGAAYDNNRNRIIFQTTDNIAIPADGNKYFLKIAYTYSNLEQGTVSISTSGVLTGIGTNFLSTLRGQPNFPTVIQFTNASLNLGQYEILSVSSDTTAIVQGVFTAAESNLSYEIVGTFTPGVYPPTDSQFPFQYDSCILTQVISTSGYYPTLVKDQEFIIAAVTNVSGTLVINDTRMDFLYELIVEKLLQEIPTYINTLGYKLQKSNPLIAITYVKNFLIGSNSVYQIGIDWKFTITTRIVDRNSSTITIMSGNGGSYKDITFFSNGDFDDWRLYYGHDGDFMTIISSLLIGGNIVLRVDCINPAIGSIPELNDDELYICPNAEEIEISYQIPISDSATLPLKNERKIFKISTPDPQLFIRADELYKIILTIPIYYNYKSFVTQPNSNIPFNITYYPVELAFDLNGNLVNPTIVVQSNNIMIGSQLASGFKSGSLESGSSSVGLSGSSDSVQIN